MRKPSRSPSPKAACGSSQEAPTPASCSSICAASSSQGEAAAKALEGAGLACNKNLIPFDPEPAELASGLRLPSNAGKTRGFGTTEFHMIGGWIVRVLDALTAGSAAGTVQAEVREQVRSFCRRFPIYPGLQQESRA